MNILRKSRSHLEYNMITLYDVNNFYPHPTNWYELYTTKITCEELDENAPMAIKIINSRNEAYLLRNVDNITITDESPVLPAMMYKGIVRLPKRRIFVRLHLKHGYECQELYKRS